ncbi:D-amino acid dehydrogenase [Bradyrhizobium prioriisuperbiae]|uniref:D-amino acid dehydrogenase n=1 Tax=Bradyrhizobium prioriisuperbiae TaxID=2854389 RepID=UPI0028E7DE70|nr:D-amino acid dehydrogenase [Bradyrhizobium prioritasuperba]
MKVLVLGAGVIGTACAYYLSRDGHEVTVVDRQSGPALETSFGNAGGVCPGFAGPWAAPGMPLKVVRWLFAQHAPLMLRPRLDLRQWQWLAAFVANCTAERFAANKARMQRIAHYSKACLVQLRADTGIAYDHGTGGVLQVFQTEDELAAAVRATKVLQSFNVTHRLLDAAEARTIEPALAQSSVTLSGGLHLPDDETGDCHLFTTRLAELLRERGVTFQTNTTIRAILREGDGITGIATDRGVLQADRYVVALASEAPMLLRPLGIDVPVYPVKGYSITIDVADSDRAPRSSVMDEHSKVMVTRLGNRVRAAGVAEISGYDRTADRNKAASVLHAARTLFPDAGDYAQAACWAGLRPMTPDGPPYLGTTPFRNLLLNIGQGSNGWTQACGSGRIVADIVDGRAPDIDLGGLTLAQR